MLLVVVVVIEVHPFYNITLTLKLNHLKNVCENVGVRLCVPSFTCGESFLDQRHAVAAAHQLHVHARQRGPRAHKLDRQAGWRAAGDLQALPAGTQSP